MFSRVTPSIYLGFALKHATAQIASQEWVLNPLYSTICYVTRNAAYFSKMQMLDGNGLWSKNTPSHCTILVVLGAGIALFYTTVVKLH